MHPEDRVFVAVMNRPQDFEIARDQGWYRVPEEKAPRGMFSEYVAFYFTAAFGELKWGVHYYGRRLGHELVTRRELLPDEPDHPRADERYYKLQLGPLQRREPPIVSQRWRRITFIHTTWDRFQAAQEINDLFAEGGEFVDRLYHALRESGLTPERCYPMREAGIEYKGTISMKITVKLGAPLSQVVGEGKTILSMPQDATVADVLAELKNRYPDFEEGLQGKGLRRPFDQVIYSLFVNARPVPFERAEATQLRDGDRIYLFLPVAGG